MKSLSALIISQITKGTSFAARAVSCNLSILIRASLALLIVAVTLFGSISGAHAEMKIVVAGDANAMGLYAVARYNADGSPDTSFDTDGKVTTDVNTSEYGFGVAVQADGKILVVGSVWYTATERDWIVIRYNSDGSLDTSTFNPTGASGGPPNSPGMVTIDFATDTDEAQAVAIQDDGKIVVAGYVDSDPSGIIDNDFGVVRLNADGSLDTDFSGDGKVTTEFGTDDVAKANGVTIQDDGMIVVVGFTNTSGTMDFAVARYNTNGTLDNSFSGDGKVVTDFQIDNDNAYDVAVQDDGMIVVSGYATTGNQNWGLARYEANGTLDTSFGTGPTLGLVVTDMGSTSEIGRAVAIQTGGEIVVGGNSGQDFAVARYDTNGTLDNSFSGDGKVVTDVGSGSNDSGYGLAIQDDGKIVVGGSSDSDFGVVRYNSDGSLDDTFDSDGKVTTDFLGGSDYGRALAIAGTVACESEDWWDLEYEYSRQLTIDAADYGYSMKLVLTGADAADIYNKSLPSGNDVRLAWYNGCVWIDLHRELESFTSSNITLWFRIQEPGGWAGGLSNYYLYYGNSSPAAVKADKSKIYDLWDDFDNMDNWTPFTEEGYHTSPTAFVDGESVSIPASTLTTLATLSTSFSAGNNFVIAVVQVENAAVQGLSIPASSLYLERVGGPTLMSNCYQIDTTTTGPDMQKWYVLMGMDTGAGLNPSYAVKTMVSLVGLSGEAKILAINGVTGEQAQAAPDQIQTSETTLTTLSTSLPAGDNVVLAIFESENTASNSGYEITNARLKTGGATLAENQYILYLGASGTTCSKQVHFIVSLHSGAPANPTYTATGISTNKKVLGGAKIVAFSITSMTGLSAAYNDGTSTSIGTSETVINTLSTSFDAGKEVVVIASEQFAAQVAYARSISSTLNKLRNDETGDQVVNQYTLSFPGQNFRDHGRGFGLLNKFTSVPANPQYDVKATASDLDLAGESKILALATPAPTPLPVVSTDGTNLTIYHTQAMKHGVFHNSFTTSNSYGFAIKSRSKKSDNTGDPYHGVSGWYHTQDQYGPDAAGPHFYAGETSTTGNRYVLSKGTETDADWEQTDAANPLPDTSFHVYETFVKTDGTMKFTRDGATCFPSGGGYSSADTTLTSGRVCMVNEGAGSSLSSQYDWILVRKFIDPEPSVTAGTESIAPRPFGFRKSITIDRTKIPGTCGTTLPDFPMLFSVTDADLATTGNGGDVASYDVANNDPRDIIFRALDDDTCGGPGTAPCGLYHEIEDYVDTTGELVAWVRIPSVNTNAASSDTVIYVYYGLSGMPYSSQNGNEVWDLNYVGVWHLKETPTVDAFAYDSTSNNNDATFMADMTSDDQVGGHIDGALDFDGNANDRVRADDKPSLGNMFDLTVETWVKLKEYPPTSSYYLSYKQHSVDPWFSWQFMVTNWGDPFYLEVNGTPLTPGNYGSCASTTVPNTTDWYHVVGVYKNGQPLKIYVNGVDDTAWASGTPSGNVGDSDGYLTLGWNVKGIQDEFRVSKIARNACWIGAEYSNQKWPNKDDFPTDGFITLGAEEPSPPTAVSLLSFTAKGQGSSVLVEWETAQEMKNMGFNLYRSTDPSGPFTKLNDKLIPGSIFSVRGEAYSFVDSRVTRGKLYYYRLEDIDVYSKKTLHGPISVDWDADGIPDDWEIAYGFNPLLNDANDDPDGDDLTNLEEYEHETDPFNPDSDGDGIPDGQDTGKVERGEPVDTRTLTKGVQILASDDTGVTLELRTGSYEMEVVQVDEKVFQRLRISEYIHGFTSEVGKAELPMKGVLLDLPDGASATLRVEETQSQTLSGYWIYPVPEKAVSGEEGSEHVAEFFAIDEAAYSSDSFYPAVVAEVGAAYMFRDQQKLQIRFYPFAFNPETKELTHHTRIRVRVEYGAAQATTRSASRALALPVPSSPTPRPSARSLAWTPPSPNPIYKILVSDEGIYRLTGAWLASNGVDVAGMALNHIRLYNLGQEVAIHVYDGGVAGQFDGGDYIEFYGEPLASQYRKYTNHNVYWLTDSGVSGGLRMGDIDGVPSGAQVPISTHTSTVRYEEDKQYENTAPGADTLDRWFFDIYVTGAEYPPIHPWYGGVGTDFDLQLPEVAGQGSLTVTLFAPSDMDHEVEVSVNSTVRTLTWSGIAYHEATIDNVDLVGGLNTVTLRCNVASDGIYVDRFEVTYPRRFVANADELKFSHGEGSRYEISGFNSNSLLAFDITQARNVRRGVAPSDFLITGPDPVEGTYTLDMEPQYGAGERTYLVLSTTELKVPIAITEVVDPDLSNGANGADYILITHRDLGWDGTGTAYPWLNRLVDLRESQLLRVKVVDVEDIYNEFSYGIVTPQAIKDFLTHAYNSWARPAPQYVLLVGDSTYDYKDNFNLGTINYVPTYLSWTDYMGEALTDDWFARVSGGDAIPDLYIGRLPAATMAQADAMVNKIFTYESTTNTKTWEKNTLVVADDQTEDYEALFEIMSNEVAALIPTEMNSVFTEYLADYGSNETLLNIAIKDKIKDGTLIVNYSGHGALQSWASPVVFHVDDVAALDNGMAAPKYPFFVSMTCLNGHFGYPEVDASDVSLAEVLLRSENEGALAAFMSTGMTQPEAQRILDVALFDAVFKQDNRALGSAISMAKQTLLANGAEFEDASKTFLLFGDPATKLKIPLPTVPSGLVAEVQGSSVLLSWQGATDANGGAVAGYNVYRSTTPGGPYTKVNTALITGTGFTDTSAQTGTFYYVVTSVDLDGDESVPSSELVVLAGARTVSAGSAGGGGGGGGCFISTMAN